ncbi:MAG: carboxylesterase/lipase family protein [Acidobacteria bacterium]|nr:carboxylesterase/lipase family protein [Acidobacteriota bacterium]
MDDSLGITRSGGLSRRAVLQRLASISIATAVVGNRTRAQTVDPVVETTHGRVRGLARDGVHVFKGIPYAASTAGRNRFLPPQQVQPWPGIRDATVYGDAAPQSPAPGGPTTAWYYAHDARGEDCLSLNIFAPAARAATPRPVMVWLHGGAWAFGCGSAPGFEGVNLARLGDVVLVTINHRLGVLGYLSLDDRDERFADSGNAGMLDVVASLRWVRDNIAVFGGNPANVTIFGQSGGGAKISSLMAMPSASGLFHKAIAQSCSGSLHGLRPVDASRMSGELAQRLELPTATGEALQSLPLDRLLAAARGGFRPVVDGRALPRHPFDPDAPAISAAIPYMVGNTETETTSGAAGDRNNFVLAADEVRLRVARTLRTEDAETRRILDGYQTAYPTYTPSELMMTISTDYQYIRNTVRQARLQAAAGTAPVHAYVFSWRTPVMEGLLKSPHMGELPFIFGTTEAAIGRVGQSPDHAPLTQMMIATWSSFARTGSPGNPLLPEWPRYDGHTRLTMKLDVTSTIERDPGGRARDLLDALPFHEY